MWAAALAPERQVYFLKQLQRVLSEGSFVASYKFALLHALADLSVTHGDDSGAPLKLTTRQIAEVIIELYWRQTLPFPVVGGEPRVLAQNTGQQAGIIAILQEASRRHAGSLQRLKHEHPAWMGVVA